MPQLLPVADPPKKLLPNKTNNTRNCSKSSKNKSKKIKKSSIYQTIPSTTLSPLIFSTNGEISATLTK